MRNKWIGKLRPDFDSDFDFDDSLNSVPFHIGLYCAEAVLNILEEHAKLLP